MEVINEDYSDYVSLSGRLVNVDGSVMRMRKPLVELKVSSGAQGEGDGGGGEHCGSRGRRWRYKVCTRVQGDGGWVQGMEVHTVVWGVERGGRITGAGQDRTKMGPLSYSDAVRCHACC